MKLSKIKNNIKKRLKIKFSKMNIIVLGAGAIGSLYVAKLSKLNNVILVGNKQHVEKINKNGLKIVGLENRIYKIKAVECERVSCLRERRASSRSSRSLACHTKVKKIESNTLILLTTKVHDSKKAINSIKHLVKKDTIILCLQNGLNSEDIVKEIIGKKCLVLRAITNFGAIFLKPGIIAYKNYGYTTIEKNLRNKKISKNFNGCGLNCQVSNNIKTDVWKKLILNCVLNPLSAILRVENRGIADEKLNPIKKLIIDECLKVAKKDGATFNFNCVKAINNGIKNSRNISSMQQDLIKGKKTEIDYLNGAVIKLGRKYGIKCPVNEVLTMIIREIEKKSMKMFK